jgi:hypothetical protein
MDTLQIVMLTTCFYGIVGIGWALWEQVEKESRGNRNEK